VNISKKQKQHSGITLGLIVGFLVMPMLLIAAISYMASKTILSLFSALAKDHKQRNTIPVVISFVVASLLIFQSIGQLTLGDVLIVLFLGVVAVFYVTRLL
jgi:choline-glycine betaine transporter